MRSSTRGGTAYVVRFGVTATVLVASTLVLVLVVLPRRYILDSGFREAGLNFPNAAVPFAPTAATLVTAGADRLRPADPMIGVADALEPAAAAGATSAEVANAPVSEAAPEPPAQGPAQLFWSRVEPLLQTGRYAESVLLFQRYLGRYPHDLGVRRELAATLTAAGRGGGAVLVLQDVLQRGGDDRDARLVLARTLRDLGRTDEAVSQYRRLFAADPSDGAIALELGRALAWSGRWAEAETVLDAALAMRPTSTPLRVELARLYYANDRPDEARVVLALLSAEANTSGEAGQLASELRARLLADSVHAAAEAHRPTLLERALAAREEGRPEEAHALLEAAMAERPDDPAVRLAHANVLEYDLAEAAAAHAALLDVERLGGGGLELSYRIAMLDVWAGRNDAARGRLERLLADLEAGALGAEPSERPDDVAVVPSAADVRALLGDLDRWEGNRIGAAGRYERVLEEDPDNDRASTGLDAMRDDVRAEIGRAERPGLGSAARAFADTDEYGRLDLSGVWSSVRDEWVVGASLGRRWVKGSGLTGASGDLGGTFVEVAPARWWRWGTVRTAGRIGAQRLRPGEQDVSVALSARLRIPGGGGVDVEVAHEPALEATSTLQSTLADVTQDRLSVALSALLGARWTGDLRADLARMRAAPSSATVTRTQAAATVTRSVSPAASLGARAAVLTYSSAAPAPGGVRLFWDPTLAISAGPLGRFTASLADAWTATLTVGPALALIDERDGHGLRALPRLSADAGLELSTSRFDARLDAFYSQARLEGYRSYGLGITLSTHRRSP